MDPKYIALAVIGYFLLKANGTDLLSGLFGGGASGAGAASGSGTPPPGPSASQLAACSAAGGVWDGVSYMCIPANVITGHSDPTTLAARLITVASAADMGSNPVLTVDQWNWFAANRLSPPLSPPDFGTDAPRDAAGQTPQMTALQYAGLFVKHVSGQASGVSGLAGLGLALGDADHVIDLRPRGSKWTM